MWWSRALAAAAVVSVVSVVAACGFRPMYAPAEGAPNVYADFADVEVNIISDRAGQELRNELRDLLTPRGRPANPRYRLSVNLGEQISKLAVRRTGLPTRADLEIFANYTLNEMETGKTVLRRETSAVGSYNLPENEYSTTIAERYARSRAVEQIAEEIRTRLAVYFSTLPREAAARPR